MILTLKELANHLRVNERTILRMQQSGQIQGVKVGGQWRFNSSQVDGLFFPESDNGADGAVPLAEITRTHLATPLSRIMQKDCMLLDLQADDAEGVIGEMCQAVMNQNLLLDFDDLKKRVMAREKLLSTGVGNGLAIPHPRDPIPALNAPAVVIFGKSSKGIDFDTPDGEPVQLFFLLVSKEIQMHLHVMGRLAHMLRDESIVAGLKKAQDADEVMRLALEVEREAFLTEKE
ncbi:MAG: PTS sugar transporter subunit IIA [Lentisphaeria bacterium]